MALVKHLNSIDYLALGSAGFALATELLGWTGGALGFAVAAFGLGTWSVLKGHKPAPYEVFDLPELIDCPPDSELFSLDYAVFDVETSGILPHKDDLLRIGAKKIRAGEIMHGTDFDERAEDALVTAGRAFHAFSEGTVVVGHNAALKMAFLRFKSDEIGVKWDRPVLDLILLSSILFGPDAPHDTDSICRRLGIDTAAAGRKLALAKARRSTVIFETMLPYLHAKGFENLEELQAACQEQAKLLNAR